VHSAHRELRSPLHGKRTSPAKNDFKKRVNELLQGEQAQI